MNTPISFHTLLARWPWKPIPHCPSRYVLSPRRLQLSLTELLNYPMNLKFTTSPLAKDPILVCRVSDGGIISYQQPNGTLIHTLNTSEGFSRKIQQLELDLASLPSLPNQSR